jgi:hypothetical protein
MKYTFICFTGLMILSYACRENNRNPEPSRTNTGNDSELGIVIADTIIYDVLIVNNNTEDLWAQQSLKGLNHDFFIDNIFKMVYDGRANAYRHETGEKLTPKQLELIEAEEGFNRKDISMVQFKEAWYIDPGRTEMTKKVLSMVLGIGQYTSSGEFKGHKAIFRVEMN